MHTRGGSGAKAYLFTSVFHLSLACSFHWFSELNWLQIFVLMRAVPQTSLAVRAARAAPETPLCESLQWCVKGKHVLHSELQGSLSRLISVMKYFPPPAFRIQASALPQTNPSRVAHTCNDTTMALSKGCFSSDEHHFECFLFGLLITAVLGNMWCMCVPFTH